METYITLYCSECGEAIRTFTNCQGLASGCCAGGKLISDSSKAMAYRGGVDTTKLMSDTPGNREKANELGWRVEKRESSDFPWVIYGPGNYFFGHWNSEEAAWATIFEALATRVMPIRKRKNILLGQV